MSFALYQSILHCFPKLEYLNLSGNQASGVHLDIIGWNDETEDNCLPAINYFLELEDAMDTGKISDQLHTYDHYFSVTWKNNNLPVKSIYNDLHYAFSKYLNAMDLKKYEDGLECDVAHDECLFQIIFNENERSITYNVSAKNAITLSKYVHIYFSEIHDTVSNNTHLKTIPFVKTNSDALKKYHFNAFKFNQMEIDTKNIGLKQEDSYFKLLINKSTKINKDEATESLKKVKSTEGIHYPIHQIAFVLINKTNKYAYPFIIDEHQRISNINKGVFYSVYLRNKLALSVYENCLTHEYLNEQALVPIELREKNKLVDCFINPYLFKASNEGNQLTCIDKSLKLDPKAIQQVEYKEGYLITVKDNQFIFEKN